MFYYMWPTQSRQMCQLLMASDGYGRVYFIACGPAHGNVLITDEICGCQTNALKEGISAKYQPAAG